MKNMKNKKIILSSILSLILCLSLILGSTYALFTSEAKTNIAVTSGNVEVSAWIDDIETYTLEVKQEGQKFALGGSASYDKATNKLTVDKIAPGDRVGLNVYVENKSNIDVAYRVNVAISGILHKALVTNITFPDKTVANLSYIDASTGWNSFGETNQVKLPMSIELPIGADSDYMNTSAEIVITVEAIQSNATNLIMIGEEQYETFDAALAEVEHGDNVKLSGLFKLTAKNSKALANKKVTFTGINDGVTVIDMKNVETGQSTSGADVTFENMTVEFANENYRGIQHAAKLTYKNCTITGKQFLYAPTVAFENCTLKNYADYSVWTYGASDVTFDKCTFTTGGKAVLVYNESRTDDFVADVKFNNCTFNSDGTVATDKAAVEAGQTPYGTNTYNVTFNNCAVNGFAANKSTSPLWGNKNSMDGDHLIVTVDSVVQDIVLEWDGSVAAVPKVVEKEVNGETVKVVEVTTPAQFAGLAAAVNAGTNNYDGVTVVLTEDMDLQGTAWTPIGNSTNKFLGSLDGQGHTVSNLNVSAENGAQGLIGFAGGTLSVTNLTIDGASVDSTNGAAVGAFVGKADGAKLTLSKLTLTGDVKLHAKSGQVGGILGNNPNGSVYASDITVDVNEGSYVSTEGNMGVYYDYIGGVFGQIWGATFENITSNIDVISDYGYGAGGISGGATGTWTNVSCSGDVIVLYTDNSVWYSNANENGNSYGEVKWYQGAGTVIGYHGNVIYNNCTSTGTLTYKDTGATSNGMTWITSESNGVAVQDSRFGCSRWKNDNTVTINNTVTAND